MDKQQRAPLAASRRHRCLSRRSWHDGPRANPARHGYRIRRRDTRRARGMAAAPSGTRHTRVHSHPYLGNQDGSELATTPAPQGLNKEGSMPKGKRMNEEEMAKYKEPASDFYA